MFLPAQRQRQEQKCELHGLSSNGPTPEAWATRTQSCYRQFDRDVEFLGNLAGSTGGYNTGFEFTSRFFGNLPKTRIDLNRSNERIALLATVEPPLPACHAGGATA